jgi:hypothetical protein
MFLTLNTSGYDAPDATGLFDTAEEALTFLCGSLIDGGVVETREEAEAYIAEDANLWIVPLSEPSLTSLTRT